MKNPTVIAGSSSPAIAWAITTIHSGRRTRTGIR